METLFTGKVVYHVETTHSTNDLATEKLKNGRVIEGTAFRTNSQTNGKGQRGRVWESNPGQNLLVSYVLYPDFLRADEQFCLVKVVSLAVKDMLDKYLIDKARIKWPNDIYINDLKIAGILIESVMKGDFMNSSVIGIGLNVNQNKFGIKVANATSVVLETGKGCDLDMFFNELSFHLEKRYMMLKDNRKSLDEAYLNAMYRKSETSTFKIGEIEENCIVTGVDSLGQLMLTRENGITQSFGMHQIKFII